LALDATVAGSSANAYITEAEADEFARADPVAGDKWLEATTEEKERDLMAAVADLDAHRKPGWLPFDAAQALVFPRSTDAVGDPAVASIPAIVKRATYEQAVYLRVNASNLRDSSGRRARGLVSFADDDGSGAQAIDPTFGLLAPKAVLLLNSLARFRPAGIVAVRMRSSYADAPLP
jgi:hypothetical protein